MQAIGTQDLTVPPGLAVWNQQNYRQTFASTSMTLLGCKLLAAFLV